MKKSFTWQILDCYDQWFSFGEFLHNGDRKVLCELYKRAFQRNTQNSSHFEEFKCFLHFLDNEFLQITTNRQDSKKILRSCLTSKFGSLTKLTKKNLGYNTIFIIYSNFFELWQVSKGWCNQNLKQRKTATPQLFLFNSCLLEVIRKGMPRQAPLSPPL